MEMIRSKIISNRLAVVYYQEDDTFFLNLVIESLFIKRNGTVVSYRLRRSVSKSEIEWGKNALIKENQFRLILSLRKVINKELKDDL